MLLGVSGIPTMMVPELLPPFPSKKQLQQSTSFPMTSPLHSLPSPIPTSPARIDARSPNISWICYACRMKLHRGNLSGCLSLCLIRSRSWPLNHTERVMFRYVCALIISHHTNQPIDSMVPLLPQRQHPIAVCKHCTSCFLGASAGSCIWRIEQ